MKHSEPDLGYDSLCYQHMKVRRWFEDELDFWLQPKHVPETSQPRISNHDLISISPSSTTPWRRHHVVVDGIATLEMAVSHVSKPGRR